MKAFIDLSALSRNLSKIQQLAGTKNIIAMVKANAYGHGLIPVTRFLESQGVKYFGVATIEEGEQLRVSGTQSAILLMSGAGLVDAPERVWAARLTPLISSIAELDALESLGHEMAVHIDLDTGLSRGGLPISEVFQVIEWFTHQKRRVKLEGLSTHFANAETANCAFSKIQLALFEQALADFELAGLKPSMIHVAKSSAIVNHFNHPNSWARPGIALYGAYDGFEPVLSLQAPITLIKTLKIGDTVGYHQTWKASRETKIALIRAGYGDGYPRVLSNQGHALLHGMRVPIIGRISMDLMTLDITGLSPKIGDTVTLMGREQQEQITAEQLASACDTISYEILTRLTERVERIPLIE